MTYVAVGQFLLQVIVDGDEILTLTLLVSIGIPLRQSQNRPMKTDQFIHEIKECIYALNAQLSVYTDANAIALFVKELTVLVQHAAQ